MSTPIFDKATGLLTIAGDDIECEFEIAVYEAVRNCQIEFEFRGYILDTAKAVDAVQEAIAQRTYH